MSNHIQLLDEINERFDQQEVRQLCFELQIDYDNLVGNTKIAKITELIQFLVRRDRLDELLVRCGKVRPNVAWKQIANLVPEETIVNDTILTSELPRFSNSEVDIFLKASGLELTSIDGAILTYEFPFPRQDWGWQENEIVFQHDDSLVDSEIPGELREISENYRSSAPNLRDSIKYCIDKMYCSLAEGGILKIDSRSVSFLESYPIARELALKQKTGNSIRRRWFSRVTNRQRPLAPNMLIAHVLVLTGDKKLLLQKRSSSVGYFAGHWSASFEEHYNAPWQSFLDPHEIHEESINVDSGIFQGIRRGLSEEIRLNDSDIGQTKIRVLGVGFEFTNFNSAIYAISELPSNCTFSAISERLKSSSEHDRFMACSFKADNLLDCIKSGDPPSDLKGELLNTRWKWHPTARLRIYLGLARHMGKNELLSHL